MKCLIPVFFAVIFFAGCKSDEFPAGVIQKDSMITLLTDIHVADGYIASIQSDSLKNNKIDFYGSIFKKHKTDSVQFKKSVEYYSKKPEEYKAMYEIVTSNLDTLQKQLLRKSSN